VDFVPFNTQIAAVIAYNNVVSSLLPVARRVERLVNVPIEAEGGMTHLTTNSQVVVSIFERFVVTQL
jgi:hypothetical protein